MAKRRSKPSSATSSNEVSIFILTVILLGLFGGMGNIFWVGAKTFVSIDTLFNIALVAACLTVIVYYLIFRRNRRHVAEILLFAVVGVGPITIAILLDWNYFKHGMEKTEIYGLDKGVAIYVGYDQAPVSVEINENLYKDYSYMLTFEGDEIKAKGSATEAWMTTAEGALGYKVLVRKELR